MRRAAAYSVLLAWVAGLVLPGPGPAASAQTPPEAGPAVESELNLTVLLWGISRLEDSPLRLDARQRSRCRELLGKVLQAAPDPMKDLQARVGEILTEPQRSFLEEQRRAGKLSLDPLELPAGDSGRDPLVDYVMELLKRRAAGEESDPRDP